MTNIINIQRFSIHDGRGIRTTVFFKGCPLKCAWCHNAESQDFSRQISFDSDKCAACGACIPACPLGALSLREGRIRTDWAACLAGKCSFFCAQACVHDAREVMGEHMPVKELVRILLRDRLFYEESGGGVTLSGGEVMAQDMAYLLALLQALHREGISVNIDTCGECAFERFLQVLPYTDTFLYDMKTYSSQLHLQYTGRGNERILKNLESLSDAGGTIALRVPVIPEVNGTEEEMERMAEFICGRVRVQQIHLLPYHRAGSDKWARLGYAGCGQFTPPTAEELEKFRQMWEQACRCPVIIGG